MTRRSRRRTAEPEHVSTEALAAHSQWLATNGGLGARLRVHGNFHGAQLAGANLRRADLKGANFRAADLTGANLQEADLTGATLYDADLTDADLTGARGVGADETGGFRLLGGAILCRATLPEGVARFDGLANVEELSKNAGKLFLSMLSADAFMQLIVARTTDVQLLTDSGTTKIPVLDTDVSVTTMFWLGPVVLFVLYFSFHLYLQRLWETLSCLPAVFPEGVLLTKKSYPWLLNDMVGLWFPHLKERAQPLAQSQEILFAVLAYLLVPISLFPFWARYLFRHDWRVTSVHMLFFTLFLWAQMMFFYLARATSQRNEVTLTWWRASWRGFWQASWWRKHGATKAGMILLPVVFVLAWGVFFYIASENAMDWGVPRELYANSTPAGIGDPLPDDFWRIKNRPDIPMYALRRWVPRVLEEIGYSPFGNFEQAELSVKPDKWLNSSDDSDPSEDVDDKPGLVRNPAHLKDSNFRYANLSGCFLVRADLRGASLVSADLRQANLWQARMVKADLTGADLLRAKLVFAEMDGTSLINARLAGANMTSADLAGANLTEADLSDAPTDESHITHTPTILKLASLQGARLFHAHLHGASLQGANLKRAKLQGADLSYAHLNGADLSDADLQGADLMGADLTGANLTRADLKGANTEGCYGCVSSK